MDLSPREVVPTAQGRKRKRPWLAYGVLGLVLVMGGVLVTQFLTNAVDYYCNVDEVGVKDGCDVGRNIRIQGVVEEGSVEQSAAGSYSFVIAYNGATMPVKVGSQPSGIFQECIPVVVRGRTVESDGSTVFEGDEVIVKHDNEYDAKNKDRLEQTNSEAAACSRKG
ncbi:MAG: cytochrome c maturation protein CcmE [Ilumatobacteraceae bacterium]